MNRLLWWGAIVWAALGLTAIGVAAKPVSRVPGPDAPAARSADSTARPARYAAQTLSKGIVERDLFRFGRKPAATAYDPARGAAPPPPAATPPPLPPKPALVLVGIVDGSPPQAILDGLPGSVGSRAMRVGDTVGGVSVIGIQGDTVRVAGMDTTWVLTVREPWKK